MAGPCDDDPVKPGEPNLARVWDFLTGGGCSLPPDQARAAELMAADPGLRERAQLCRQFTLRAAKRAAAAGVRQVIELGAGLPASPAIHDEARAVVAYVDCDGLAVRFLAVTHGSDPGIAVVHADLTDPAAVLADPALLKVIELARPACVILSGVLYAIEPPKAAEITGAYMAALPAGSWLACSAPSYADRGVLDAIRRAAGADVYSYAPGDFAALFAGTDLIPPGIGAVRFWLAGLRWIPQDARVTTLAGVGVKRLPGHGTQRRPGTGRRHRLAPLLPAVLPGGGHQDGHVAVPLQAHRRGGDLLAEPEHDGIIAGISGGRYRLCCLL